MDGNNNYHILENNGSTNSTMERERSRSVSEEWYDDVGVTDAVVYTMNKHPPPIWKPERDKLKAPPLPPNRRANSSEPEVVSPRHRALLPLSRPQGLQVSPTHSKPLPLPKHMGSTGDLSTAVGSMQQVRKDLFGIKDNPVFKRKLEEKRQEIYGGTSHGRSLSMGEGEDLAMESYESVLFTVDDNMRAPMPPPKTHSMERELLSPPPPPLPSRELINPAATHQRPGQLKERGSPFHQSSGRPQEKVSPGRCSSGSTPTSPPPLPSRELLDPSRPAFDTTILSSMNLLKEEDAPPVPVRLSSHRHGAERPPIPIPSPEMEKQTRLRLPGQREEAVLPGLRQEHRQVRRRRNSLPSPQPSPQHSPQHSPALSYSGGSELDRTRRMPIPGAGQRSRLEPPHMAIAQGLSAPNTRLQPKSMPLPKPKPAKAPQLAAQSPNEVEVYDDITHPLDQDVYDDVEFNTENTVQHNATPPAHKDHAAKPKVSPRCQRREKQNPPLLHKPMVSPVRDTHLPPSAKPQPPVKPAVKPAVTKKPTPPQKPVVAKKPVLAEKPTLAEKPALAGKPTLAEKPAPAKRPEIVARKPAVANPSATPPVAAPRKPAGPPTPPRRYKPTNDSVPSPQSSPLHHPPSKHRAKPMVPKKPVPSLCS